MRATGEEELLGTNRTLATTLSVRDAYLAPSTSFRSR